MSKRNCIRKYYARAAFVFGLFVSTSLVAMEREEKENFGSGVKSSMKSEKDVPSKRPFSSFLSKEFTFEELKAAVSVTMPLSSDNERFLEHLWGESFVSSQDIIGFVRPNIRKNGYGLRCWHSSPLFKLLAKESDEGSRSLLLDRDETLLKPMNAPKTTSAFDAKSEKEVIRYKRPFQSFLSNKTMTFEEFKIHVRGEGELTEGQVSFLEDLWDPSDEKRNAFFSKNAWASPDDKKTAYGGFETIGRLVIYLAINKSLKGRSLRGEQITRVKQLLERGESNPPVHAFLTKEKTTLTEVQNYINVRDHLHETNRKFLRDLWDDTSFADVREIIAYITVNFSNKGYGLHGKQLDAFMELLPNGLDPKTITFLTEPPKYSLVGLGFGPKDIIQYIESKMCYDFRGKIYLDPVRKQLISEIFEQIKGIDLSDLGAEKEVEQIVTPLLSGFDELGREKLKFRQDQEWSNWLEARIDEAKKNFFLTEAKNHGCNLRRESQGCHGSFWYEYDWVRVNNDTGEVEIVRRGADYGLGYSGV